MLDVPKLHCTLRMQVVMCVSVLLFSVLHLTQHYAHIVHHAIHVYTNVCSVIYNPICNPIRHTLHMLYVQPYNNITSLSQSASPTSFGGPSTHDKNEC